ncbi:MAG: DUF4301 family protein [Deltaproteobacteria bacterium]|nr:DUF4301 family protein [Deltaproteobacteria bacterium]
MPAIRGKTTKKTWSLSREDLAHLRALGISKTRTLQQIALLQKAGHHRKLDRPCLVGDGIHRISRTEARSLIPVQEAGASAGRFLKFVPASGAASRMFESLLHYHRQSEVSQIHQIRERARQGGPRARALLYFLEEWRCFPFSEALRARILAEGLKPGPLTKGDRWRTMLDLLLTGRGLNYQVLPKALMTFHRYPDGCRSALEEHLVEAAATIRDEKGRSHLHFTISPEHEDLFREHLSAVKPKHEEQFGARFEISYSHQHRSTDTIALDLEGRPLRDAGGRLYLRPGGHGALLVNLHRLGGDLVYIKNIDNVVPDHLKAATIDWKKILGGYLIQTQRRVNRQLEKLQKKRLTKKDLETGLDFLREVLAVSEPQGFWKWPAELRREFLLQKLNRPLRVCGVVKNQGETGGGPFWVRGRDGNLTRQIVESVQVDLESEEQQEIWSRATHFNPVDLVCSLRDFQGRPFDLRRYVDPEAVFISRKSQNGLALRALELPGLWNGAMADWITIFLEVPLETFNPVKTILDLLRPEHQPPEKC